MLGNGLEPKPRVLFRPGRWAQRPGVGAETRPLDSVQDTSLYFPPRHTHRGSLIGDGTQFRLQLWS